MKYATFFLFLACLACNTLMAKPENNASSSEVAEREQLKQDQKKIESNYASKEAECYKKFSVNPCIDVAKIERNAALAENKRRVVLLNDLKREEKRQSVLKTPKAIPSNSKSNDAADSKLRSKEMTDKNERINAAKGRVEAANQKKRQAQIKADQRSRKNMLSADAVATYRKKLKAAEEHKSTVEQKNAGNTKPKASSLPIPKPMPN